MSASRKGSSAAASVTSSSSSGGSTTTSSGTASATGVSSSAAGSGSSVSKKHPRQVFDEVALGVISFLEKHEGVTDVKFVASEGCTESRIREWECTEDVKLPSDIRAFLKLMDGFTMQWHMKWKGSIIPLGLMRLHCLAEMKPCVVRGDRRAICIDEGRTAMLIRGVCESDSTGSGQVWFEDAAGEWHFVSNSFSDFLRVMVLHLGLPEWRYAFTPFGLPPNSMAWMRFLCPTRLQMDLKHCASHSGWIIPLRKLPKRKPKRSKIDLRRIDHIVRNHHKQQTSASQGSGKSGGKSNKRTKKS